MNKRTESHDATSSEQVEQLERAFLRGRIDRRTFMRSALAVGLSFATARVIAQEGAKASAVQSYNQRNLQARYDYVVCGAGSAGCVVAARLSENPDVSVLLLEAGDTDDVPSIRDPLQWATNIGTPRTYVYSFKSERLNGRTVGLPMGRAIGGGSAVNVSVWARGHKHNYDEWARMSGDPGWNYDSVLSIYRRIEDWQGPSSRWRGKGGPVYVRQLQDVNPIAPAMVEACSAAGIPAVDDINGAVMEGNGGAGIADALIKDGRRRGVAAAYLHPALARANLTVLTNAEVVSVLLEGDRCTGVEFIRDGKREAISAAREVVLSAGAIGTPKLLMLSGVGPDAELKRVGIKTRIDSPQVGQNLMDHVLLGGCVWEYRTPLPPRNNAAEATFFTKSDAQQPCPDLQPFQIEVPFVTDTNSKQFQVPEASWVIAPGLVQPKSRGHMRLASANSKDMPLVDPNYLAEPQDMKALVRCVELCRDVGNSKRMSEFAKREVMPGPLKGRDLENFIRNATGTYFHMAGTCAMGSEVSSVVDAQLRVRGVRGLRVADASVMPQLTTGNTMAACVIIGERAASFLKSA